MAKKQKENKISPSKSGPPFTIRMGIPTMDHLWNDLTKRFQSGNLTNAESDLYRKWGKALVLLSNNPFYPSLKSHEISSLTVKYGNKVFESYLENNTPSAARIFWIYGKKRGEIIILALEPHPKRGGYGLTKLAREPLS